MKEMQKKAVLFAPFWRQPNHVGTYRVDRFRRWLIDAGYSVVVIRAGSSDAEREEAWGLEITVRDPLGFYPDPTPGSTHVSMRKPNKLRRAVACWLFNPDPTVIWARMAARSRRVLQATQGADFILSSSPPDSAHVGAWRISRRLSISHIVDLRDGWLDEPLRPVLHNSAFRRWRERRLEAPILHNAKRIQVTSDVWKKLLCARYPTLTGKVQVLTNGYPEHVSMPDSGATRTPGSPFVLVHAGRFTDSDSRRRPALLLEPLLHELSAQQSIGVVQLLGVLSEDDLAFIEPFKDRYARIGWRLECPGSLPRTELLNVLSSADGLLLLSTSHAAIPSKLFEYIPTGKPLFVVTHRESAVWNICSELPQAVLVEIGSENGVSESDPPFYQKTETQIPPGYSEESLKKTFREVIAG